jgi:hypothetical protein
MPAPRYLTGFGPGQLGAQPQTRRLFGMISPASITVRSEFTSSCFTVVYKNATPRPSADRAATLMDGDRMNLASLTIHGSDARRFLGGSRGWLSAAAVAAILAGATQVQALPSAISYESFGFNFAYLARSSTTIGTLDYTEPGCAGDCVATTALGTDPHESLAANEVVYEYTAGGHAEADLQYYFEYVNNPGTYTITMHTSDVFNISANSAGENLLTVGPSDGDYTDFFHFSGVAAEEKQCYNGCNINVVTTVASAPFSNTTLQLQANTIYTVFLSSYINPSTDGAMNFASIDPTFTTSASGGQFLFSPGVSAGGVPEPASWTMMLFGVALAGSAIRRAGRKSKVSASAA